MAITVKFRRGSTAQSNSFLGEEGELYIDKDKDTIVVHDGTTVGGFPLASESWVTQAIANFGTSSFSGDYNDLTNKPTIPTVPSTLSSFTNDTGFITSNLTSALRTDGYSITGGNYDGSYVSFAVGLGAVIGSTYDGNVYVQTGTGGTVAKTWQYKANGELLFPDSTTQSTAWTGTYSYNNLSNLPNLVKAAVEWSPNHTLAYGTRYLIGDVVYDSGNIYVANYDNESLPTSNTTYWTNLGAGNRLNIDGRDIPNISYTQLSNLPTGLATETYVNTQVANIVGSSPEALNTLNGLAAALGDDPNFATTITNQIGLKANTSSLATVATSGSYTDLTNKPTIPTALSSFTNDTNYITRTGISVSGSLSYNSSTGVISYTAPTLATVATSGSYNDLTDKPTIPTVPTAVSAFTNDANYATQSYVTTQVSNLSTVYQPLNSNLTALSTNGFGTTANTIPRYDAAGWLFIGANWKVKEVSGVLFFAHGATNRMKIDSSGNLTVTGDITAFGTV